tara:strand:+ start:758 stop:991 length:234 start_codon:yes stop_codon:yes gene_type:complete
MNANYALFFVTETFDETDRDTGEITSSTVQYACTPENVSMYVENVNHSRKISIEKIEVNPIKRKVSYTEKVPYLSVA